MEKRISGYSGSFLALRTGAITEQYPHHITKANQQWFPQRKETPRNGDLLLSKSEFESNGKVNTDPTLSTFLFQREKSADISRPSLCTDPLPSVKIGEGASTPSPLFTEGERGSLYTDYSRPLCWF